MSKLKESAFPTPDVYHANGQIEYGETGITIRDYFAAKALQGWLARYTDRSHPVERGVENFVASMSYKMADAMLEERKKIKAAKT